MCLAVCVVEFFGLMLFYNDTDVLLFFWAIEKFILCGAITFVALMCKELQEGSEALADGDLNYKLDTSHMVLSFKEHGENLNRIGLDCFEPKGAFYVFPCIRSSGLSSDEFCERFLREEKVAVISGSAFGPGGEGFIRCCYATSMKDIAEALTRMDNFLTNLRKKQAREG